MTPQFGPSELQRALARADVEELNKCVEVYYRWTKLSGKDKELHWPDELDIWFGAEERDRSLALVVLAMANKDDEEFLIGVVCGLLESTLSHSPANEGKPLSAEFLQRVVDEARRTPRFRWMLSAMWTTGMPVCEAKAIAEAVNGASCETDPLPPRPWA